ncbi:uncharacterized protein LOC131249565 [Magnolia sinica]|uniref:uncharacterized protein LOC131249565 n=1 Tax=Magnolia sinica TaxID=86752 RepID=UPI00265A8716|nr:uncharacterized protein LOC131249565 [Magnolia sinica]
MLINVDGSASGNPGPSGGGGFCRNSSGNLIFAFYSGYGDDTNKRAELRVLHDAMEINVSFGFNQVELESNSQFVVDAFRGKSTLAWKWRYWLSRIEGIKKKGIFSISLIPREGNGLADGLAREGVACQGNVLFKNEKDLPICTRDLYLLDKVGLGAIRES